MKIFEMINRGVGTHGLGGTLLTVNDILQIEDDATGGGTDQLTFQHFRNIVSLTLIPFQMNAFNKNDLYMFLRDHLNEASSSQGSTWQGNVCYGEEALDFYDPAIRAQLDREDKKGLFLLRDNEASEIFTNISAHVTIDGKRYDPRAGNKIYYFGFIHNFRYAYQLKAVTDFIALVPDDDSIKLFLDDLSDSEMATIRANNGVSVTINTSFPINKLLREVQSAHGNAYINDFVLYIKAEHVKTGNLSGLYRTYKVTVEINGPNGEVYLCSRVVTHRLDVPYTVPKYFEVFVSSSLFYKRVLAAEINEIGPEIMSYG